MRTFSIMLHTVQEVEEFVSLATMQPFEITVGSEELWVNAKSLMGYFCLNPFRPMQVRMNCSEEEYWSFRNAAQRFRVEEVCC